MLRMVGFNKRVLETGCASGHMSELLNAQGCTVVGMEIESSIVEPAMQWLERVVIGDLEDREVWSDLEGEYFDDILFGDVLEHLKDPLTSLREAALREGLGVNGPVAMHRNTPGGARLDWTILYLEDARFGEAIPFVIDWGKTPHPSTSLPGGCRLKSFTVTHPEAEALSRLHAALDIPVAVKRAAYPGFVVELSTPKGEVVLTQP